MCNYPINYVEIEHIYNQTIGTGYRTLAITSAKNGEGKTSLVKALAKRAELSGKKVLVVELNTFNPALSEKLRDQLAEKPSKIIAMKDQGYSLLPAPRTLQDIMRFKETSILITAIKDWLNDYDCLLFDTSSLQSLNQSNIPPEIVCEVCEGTLLIIEAGTTPANFIEEAIKKLKNKKVNLIGSVINDKHNPTLLSELIRETHRFDQILPKAMSKVRNTIASLVLLNISV
jgi:Mrp family chromosome partitioning ATPase